MMFVRTTQNHGAMLLASLLAFTVCLPARAADEASLRAAAEGGDAGAQFELAKVCMEQSISWTERSAQNGDRAAQAAMGRLCLGDLQREKKACAAWAEKAAAQGDFESAYFAGALVLKNSDWGDSAKGIRLMRTAAEGGNARAQAAMAVLCQRGEAMAKDTEQAFHWAEKAAAQGDPMGKRLLATCYLDGIGTYRDMRQAAKWMYLALKAGDGEANSLWTKNEMGLDLWREDITEETRGQDEAE